MAPYCEVVHPHMFLQTYFPQSFGNPKRSKTLLRRPAMSAPFLAGYPAKKTGLDTGFTLIELLAVVGIIAILASLLFPRAGEWIETANKAGCASNLKTLGGAIHAFTSDYGYFPPAAGETNETGGYIHQAWLQEAGTYLGLDWKDMVQTGAIKGPNVFVCPSDREATGWRYTYAENNDTRTDLAPNGHLRPQNLANPSAYALVSDSFGKYYLAASTKAQLESYGVTRRHNGHPNILYADGHVASFTGEVLGYKDGTPQDFYLKMWRWNGRVSN